MEPPCTSIYTTIWLVRETFTCIFSSYSKCDVNFIWRHIFHCYSQQKKSLITVLNFRYYLYTSWLARETFTGVFSSYSKRDVNFFVAINNRKKSGKKGLITVLNFCYYLNNVLSTIKSKIMPLKFCSGLKLISCFFQSFHFCLGLKMQ